MPELGRTLSQARVARGLTLEDCERDTRISKRYLDALEREDWKVFPAPVYSRAFLRTYAQYLGLNPAELMRLFQTQTEEPVIRPLPEVAGPQPTANMNFVLAGVVLVVLLFAGAFMFLSRGGGNGDETVKNPLPTITTEGQARAVACSSRESASPFRRSRRVKCPILSVCVPMTRSSRWSKQGSAT